MAGNRRKMISQSNLKLKFWNVATTFVSNLEWFQKSGYKGNHIIEDWPSLKKEPRVGQAEPKNDVKKQLQINTF